MCTQGKTDLRDVSKLVSELKIAVFTLHFRNSLLIAKIFKFALVFNRNEMYDE